MKIDTDAFLFDHTRKPFCFPVQADAPSDPVKVTVGFVCIEAIGAHDPGRKLSASEIVKRNKLIERIYAGGDVEITGEEASSMIAEVAACEMFSPRVKAETIRHIDPAFYAQSA